MPRFVAGRTVQSRSRVYCTAVAKYYWRKSKVVTGELDSGAQAWLETGSVLIYGLDEDLTLPPQARSPLDVLQVNSISAVSSTLKLADWMLWSVDRSLDVYRR